MLNLLIMQHNVLLTKKRDLKLALKNQEIGCHNTQVQATIVVKVQ